MLVWSIMLYLIGPHCPPYNPPPEIATYKRAYPLNVEPLPDWRAELADIDRRLIKDGVTTGD